MKIYRVESSFSALNDDSGIVKIRQELCVQSTPYRGFDSMKTRTWLKFCGINSSSFHHHSDNYESHESIPIPHDDKLLVENANDAIKTKWNKDYSQFENYIPLWLISLYHFAFASEYDMMRWFTREEREDLKDRGMYIAIYEVHEDEVIIGGHQVMFRKSHAELIDFIEMK